MSDVRGYYDQSYPPSIYGPPVPTLVLINPTTGVTGVAANITLTGTGFTEDAVVLVGGVAAGAGTTTTVVSPTQITLAYVALPAAGVLALSVSTDGGVTASRNFTVTAAEEEPTNEPVPDPPPYGDEETTP